MVLTALWAGIHPTRQLPVVLDCGSNVKSMASNAYINHVSVFAALWHCGSAFWLIGPSCILVYDRNALSGRNTMNFVDKFVKAARKSDDIQGTGCVTLAALLAALQVSKVKLTDVPVVCFGAGLVGMDIVAQIRDATAAESKKSKDEALKQIWQFSGASSSHPQGDQLTPAKSTFARDG
ncbi:hypothetical protein BDFG_02012 [Blastomyces dermatitidis ATCC 26199]|nr:hypothetical protein BDFG_02012 [Blastomyces dermatitidis ATCC 26199]